MPKSHGLAQFNSFCSMSEAEEMCNFQIDIAYDLKDEDKFARPPACQTASPDFSFCNVKQLAGVCG